MQLILYYQVYNLKGIQIELLQISFTASDGDSLTSDTTEILTLDSIGAAPPTIEVPKSKISVKAENEALLPGIVVTDIDSTTVS